MKKHMIRLFVPLISVLLLLAGCGGGNDVKTGGNEGENTANGQTNEGSGEENQGETYTFKLAHISHEENIWHKQAMKFAEELKRLSDGRMTVEFYPGGQLGNEADMVQQIEAGSLDFGIITAAYLSSRAEAFNAWGLPFLFENVEEGVKMRETQAAQDILDSLSSQGVLGLEYAFVGNRHLLMQDTPVTSPQDLKGKKIRITSGPSIVDFWNAVGASPEAIPLPEVYTSLQTGVIDGIDIDLGAIREQKFYEVADQLTLTNHITFTGIMMMGKSIYDSLSLEDQEIVKEAMKLAGDWAAEEVVKIEQTNLEALRDTGVNIHEFDSSAFETVANDLYDKYSSNPLIKAFIEAAKNQ